MKIAPASIGSGGLLLQSILFEGPLLLHDHSRFAFYGMCVEHSQQGSVLQFYSCGVAQIRGSFVDIQNVVRIPGFAAIIAESNANTEGLLSTAVCADQDSGGMLHNMCGGTAGLCKDSSGNAPGFAAVGGLCLEGIEAFVGSDVAKDRAIFQLEGIGFAGFHVFAVNLNGGNLSDKFHGAV